MYIIYSDMIYIKGNALLILHLIITNTKMLPELECWSSKHTNGDISVQAAPIDYLILGM